MSNRKSASTKDHSTSETRISRLSLSDAKNNSKTHDRPAIFIEESKDRGQHIHSIK